MRKAGMTQSDRVLRHLKDYGSVTPVEAMAEYGIMRLGARIWDLKKQGHVIATERETGVNRYGEKTAYARYRMGMRTSSDTENSPVESFQRERVGRPPSMGPGQARNEE